MEIVSPTPLPGASTGPTYREQGPVEKMVSGFLIRYRGKTYDAYIDDLLHYLQWCRDSRIHPLLVQRAELEAYLRWMQENPAGWAESTIARRIGTVCGMYRMATRDRILQINPGEFVDRPTVDKEKQRRTLLQPTEFAILVKYILVHGTVQEKAYLACCGLRGLRIGEACSLNVDSYTWVAGHRVLRFIGKGNRARIVDVPAAAALVLEAAIAGRGPDEPILINQEGRRLNRVNGDAMLKRLAAAAGVDTDISNHSLRRSFVTLARALGESLDDIAVTVGHKSTATTMIYDGQARGLERDVSARTAARLVSMGSGGIAS